MKQVYFIFFAVILLTTNLAHAGENKTTAGASPTLLFKEPVTSMEMVLVKGGCYQMGSSNDDCDANPDERPQHKVCVDDFYLGKYEVTQGQWQAIMGSNTSAVSTCGADNCPIDNVAWSDIKEFIRRLNSKSSGSKYRLPTEAEWEYAARSGGKDEKFAGGGNVDTVSWYAANSGKLNHPVGTKVPNGLGIYDMSGNVWEMTSDWYAGDYYSSSPSNNPKGPGSGIDHVIRGGCRTGGVANQRTTRRIYIYDRTGSDRGGNVGFRLLRAT